MSEAKKYDRSYKEQSVKPALEIGVKRAGEELKVPYGTMYGWVQAAKNGDPDIEERTPENAMSPADEIRQLRSEVKRLRITKADREARKSDDLLKSDFKADKPFSKCVTDITKVKAKNGKLYVSAIFDCYDLTAVGLSMDDNMRAELCAATVENTATAY